MEENQSQEQEVAQSPTNENKSSSALLAGGLVILAVVLVGGYLLMSGNKNKASVVENTTITTPTITAESETVNDEIPPEGNSSTESQEVMAGETGAIAVEGGSFYFKPNVIKAKVGKPVVIKFTTIGNMPHDFVIDEFDVKTQQITNDTLEFEFTPTKAGTYEFYCSVGNHRKMGMKGSLVVEK